MLTDSVLYEIGEIMIQKLLLEEQIYWEIGFISKVSVIYSSQNGHEGDLTLMRAASQTV